MCCGCGGDGGWLWGGCPRGSCTSGRGFWLVVVLLVVCPAVPTPFSLCLSVPLVQSTISFLFSSVGSVGFASVVVCCRLKKASCLSLAPYLLVVETVFLGETGEALRTNFYPSISGFITTSTLGWLNARTLERQPSLFSANLQINIYIFIVYFIICLRKLFKKFNTKIKISICIGILISSLLNF